DEFDTELRLSLAQPPYWWKGPVLTRPVLPDENQMANIHGYVDPETVSTLLIIDVQYAPGGPTHHWWLAAEPPMGTHPDPAGAVAAVRGIGEDFDPFAELDPSHSYIRPWGGPQRATVRGFYRGRWIQTEFKRTDGGEIGRWDALQPLLEPWP